MQQFPHTQHDQCLVLPYYLHQKIMQKKLEILKKQFLRWSSWFLATQENRSLCITCGFFLLWISWIDIVVLKNFAIFARKHLWWILFLINLLIRTPILKNIASFTNDLVWRFKKWEPQCEKRKASSQSWPCGVDEGHSLLEINWSLWIYKGVSNK